MTSHTFGLLYQHTPPSGSCTHTYASDVSQWHVDLGKVYKIDHIKFWGRTDNHQDRIKWARVSTIN